MFSKPVIYIQISPELLTLKNLSTGESVAEIPEMAISKPPKREILAVGLQARSAATSQSAEIVNPFAHPRSLVSDFTAAELLIKHQLHRVFRPSLLTPAPCIVIHPLGSPVGGFTQIELRALREMARGAGAAEVRVRTGRVLGDQEVIAAIKSNSGEWEQG
ncbi:MAG: rod shape-determining protein [Gallionellaceae bacterium]|jgi:rod shape-determining protein MreB|nr:rod shape-determining protein [Gallionellaceae bacterium]